MLHLHPRYWIVTVTAKPVYVQFLETGSSRSSHQPYSSGLYEFLWSGFPFYHIELSGYKAQSSTILLLQQLQNQWNWFAVSCCNNLQVVQLAINSHTFYTRSLFTGFTQCHYSLVCSFHETLTYFTLVTYFVIDIWYWRLFEAIFMLDVPKDVYSMSISKVVLSQYFYAQLDAQAIDGLNSNRKVALRPAAD